MNGNDFLYIGKNAEELTLCVPYPTVGNAAFDTQFNLVTQVNARGVTVGQLAGKARHTQTVGWSLIAAADWWPLYRWFEANGPFCTIRYFSHNAGEWRTGRFICSGFSCEPLLVNQDGAAQYYENATFTLASTGDS